MKIYDNERDLDYMAEQRLAEIYEQGFKSVEEWYDFQMRLKLAGEFVRKHRSKCSH